ncbi:hypothetical protein V7152_19495 [Neobacillus drentensis]|uniref:hypothetical protein n=1 Tax=Neobacillus drentensis TaxID=220684 RepID=UPI002FFFFC0F
MRRRNWILFFISIFFVTGLLNGAAYAANSNKSDRVAANVTPDPNSLQRQVELLQDWIAPQSAKEAVKTWAKAVKLRNGAVQFAVLSPDLQKQTKGTFEELNWVTGLSSPWVDKYPILKRSKTDKEVWVYTVEFRLATSTGYAGSVRAYLTIENLNEKWVITGIKSDGSNSLEAITVVPSNP